jgi:hypothetical protein
MALSVSPRALKLREVIVNKQYIKEWSGNKRIGATIAKCKQKKKQGVPVYAPANGLASSEPNGFPASESSPGRQAKRGRPETMKRIDEKIPMLIFLPSRQLNRGKGLMTPPSPNNSPS